MELFSVGKAMKSFRKENGYTQTEFARLLGVSKQTISSYENGKSTPNMAVLIEFSLLSDIPIADLALLQEKLNKIKEPDAKLIEVLSSFRSLSIHNFLKKPASQRESIMKNIAETINNSIDEHIF